MARAAQAVTMDLSATLRRQWLVWGLLPVTAVGAVAIVIGVFLGSPLAQGSRSQEVQLQAAMAIVAATFLAGFWVEGLRTASERIVTKLAEAVHKPLGELTSVDFRESVDAVKAIVAEAHWSALLLGWAGALVPVVSALAKMPADHVAVVAIMSELYILYVLSRHHHAVEVVQAADDGELAYEAQVLAQFRAFRPTPLQRVWMLFGWRPTLDDPGGRSSSARKGQR